MRMIILLAATVFALALYVLHVDTYALGPHAALQASPFAGLTPMSLSIPTEGRAAYVQPVAQSNAPKHGVPPVPGQ
jgi:hypothetical protein